MVQTLRSYEEVMTSPLPPFMRSMIAFLIVCIFIPFSWGNERMVKPRSLPKGMSLSEVTRRIPGVEQIGNHLALKSGLTPDELKATVEKLVDLLDLLPLFKAFLQSRMSAELLS